MALPTRYLAMLCRLVVAKEQSPQVRPKEREVKVSQLGPVPIGERKDQQKQLLIALRGNERICLFLKLGKSLLLLVLIHMKGPPLCF